VHSALAGIVPPERIIATRFVYDERTGEVASIARVPAGYGKVAAVDELRDQLGIPGDRMVYVGDGSSDIHVMLHVNRCDGLTIAASEGALHRAHRAAHRDERGRPERTDPVLEDILGYNRNQIRALFERHGVSDPGMGPRAHRLAHDPRGRGSILTPASPRARSCPAGMVSELGYAAGVITVASFLPQVVRAWRTRQTRDLSLGSLALLILAGSLWIVYGAMSARLARGGHERRDGGAAGAAGGSEGAIRLRAGGPGVEVQDQGVSSLETCSARTALPGVRGPAALTRPVLGRDGAVGASVRRGIPAS
jgi:hypothetical protein